MSNSIGKVDLNRVSLNNASLSSKHATKEFKKYLLEAQNELKFSKHALERLKTRDINLNKTQQIKLTEATEKANSKGAKNALILLNDVAFIVNIPSKTVVTALNEDESKERVFTQIDSTIIIKEELDR